MSRRLAVFDIDGTLTATNEVDDECFHRAVTHALGTGPLDNVEWRDAPHVTDTALETHHADALLKAASDPRIWQFTNSIIRNAAEVQKYVEMALEWQQAGTCVPFVTMDQESQQIIGSTRFENINVANRRAEIGWTWLNPEWWRTAINTEAKYLMVRHAFEQWECIRVEFKAGAKNERSRAAILRLGATEEGTLRQHLIGHDGLYRDSVYYSIIDVEWPAVKPRLESRLRKEDGTRARHQSARADRGVGN